MLRIGFDVPTWTNKPFRDFIKEELIEYYYKLRLSCCGRKEVDGNSSSTDLYVVSLQQEIISRMK